MPRFYLDSVEYESPNAKLEGATIKEIAGVLATHQLIACDPGKDRYVADWDLVDVDGQRFTYVPPATY